MAKRRTYFLLVKLQSGDPASLTIIREGNYVAAQLRSFGDYLKQVFSQVNHSDFENADIWTLLALVERGFQRVHGISYEYCGPTGKAKTADDWGAELEARANDPRVHAFQRPGEKGWAYGVHERDLPALIEEARRKGSI
ncbi:hypothetical protein HJA87_06225 [Rhizobium bangladeshense]|uniref:Uncharacterized protein n=1 Tax=Rhizobium bangladeshense TaxID=1138189 RepID=A0ABS7LDH8_9HYPH|nr:hypothetical protein [Rhizobium bangladeshense]MBY3589480.1 hypothetical protein [Rhizobium bangladeshense]